MQGGAETNVEKTLRQWHSTGFCLAANLRRKGVVYKAVHGLSPTVELGMIWRQDDPGAVLSSTLRMARLSFNDKNVISSSREQAVSRVPNETSRVPNYGP
jgi:hypothetical protein